MGAAELLPVIALVSIVTVEWGGWALLALITGGEEVSAFRQRFFRAGHAHAGVLLVLALAYYLYLPRTDFSSGLEWAAGITMLIGIQAQAGGFFVHIVRGEDGRSTLGPRISRSAPWSWPRRCSRWPSAWRPTSSGAPGGRAPAGPSGRSP